MAGRGASCFGRGALRYEGGGSGVGDGVGAPCWALLPPGLGRPGPNVIEDVLGGLGWRCRCGAGFGLGFGLGCGLRSWRADGFGWLFGGASGFRLGRGCGPRGGWALAAAGLLAVEAGSGARLGGVPRGLGGGVLDEDVVLVGDLQGAASPMGVEGELPDMNAGEMAKEGFYLVKYVLHHRYRQGWRFLTLCEGFGVKEATWEPFSAFVLPGGRLNTVLLDYLSQNNLGELLRLAETLASKTKAKD